jgi:hypothetical protein
MKDLLGTIRTLAWIALIAAIYQELRKPPAERTWHGKVGGMIPYDFRMPTLERVKTAYWDPSSNTVFTEKVIGVGWAVNIPVLIRKLNEAAAQYSQVSRQVRDEVSRYVPQMSGRRPGDGRPPES